MEVVRTGRGVREEVARLRAGGHRVALVPTMGFLHEGHLSLVDRALEAADRVVMSIYVNPLQFGPDEDLDAYPRDLERDLTLADGRGVALVFAPDDSEMYPAGEPRVTVDPGPMADVLCGAHRPGHFRGVLTVVSKLLNLVGPQVAVFGRKDFQQLVLIRRMAEDLSMPVEIVAGPVVREDDGLALSSRNGYLTPGEREVAPGLHRGLEAAVSDFRAGESRAERLLAAFREELERHPGFRLQYVEVVDPGTLESLEEVGAGAVMAAAAHLGETRLIDNVVLE